MRLQVFGHHALLAPDRRAAGSHLGTDRQAIDGGQIRLGQIRRGGIKKPLALCIQQHDAATDIGVAGFDIVDDRLEDIGDAVFAGQQFEHMGADLTL